MESYGVLITGASTGFGHELALELPKRGHRPVASMRDVGGRNADRAEALRREGIPVVDMDVTEDASVEEGVKAAVAAVGDIDVLVNNAGFGILGPTEAVTIEDLRTQFETNVFGPHRVARAILPRMRERRTGLIISLSSGAGRFAFPGQNPYNASKWALEAMAESMRYELAPLGVDSVIIEPGPYGTNFFTSARQPSDTDRIAAYGHVADAAKTRLKTMPKADPAEMVTAMVELIETPRGKRPTRLVMHPLLGAQMERLNREQSRCMQDVLDLYGPGQWKDNGV